MWLFVLLRGCPKQSTLEDLAKSIMRFEEAEVWNLKLEPRYVI
jgi:hypothetical protein